MTVASRNIGCGYWSLRKLQFSKIIWRLDFKCLRFNATRRSINRSVYLVFDLETMRFKFLRENRLGAGGVQNLESLGLTEFRGKEKCTKSIAYRHFVDVVSNSCYFQSDHCTDLPQSSAMLLIFPDVQSRIGGGVYELTAKITWTQQLPVIPTRSVRCCKWFYSLFN